MWNAMTDFICMEVSVKTISSGVGTNFELGGQGAGA